MAVTSLPLTSPFSNVLFFLLHRACQPSHHSSVIPEHFVLPLPCHPHTELMEEEAERWK